MIVKNESEVIERCLSSIVDQIDYWVIVDTGSTDGTQKKIQNLLKKKPGHLYERPWVNFGHNRDEALQLAKGKADYILFIDADEVFEGKIDKENLSADAYLINVFTSIQPDTFFKRGVMVKDKANFSWKGKIHETLHTAINEPVVDEIKNSRYLAATKDGARSKDPNKYLKDALTLENALLEEPDNDDYVYYLAQSYFNAGHIERALDNYQRYCQMTRRGSNLYWAKFMVGYLQIVMKKDVELISKNMTDVFLLDPHRAEPIYFLAEYYYNKEQPLVAFSLLQLIIHLQAPLATDKPGAYVLQEVYNYKTLALYLNCALKLGTDKVQVKKICQELLQRPQLPESITSEVRNLMTSFNDK